MIIVGISNISEELWATGGGCQGGKKSHHGERIQWLLHSGGSKIQAREKRPLNCGCRIVTSIPCLHLIRFKPVETIRDLSLYKTQVFLLRMSVCSHQLSLNFPGNSAHLVPMHSLFSLGKVTQHIMLKPTSTSILNLS